MGVVRATALQGWGSQGKGLRLAERARAAGAPVPWSRVQGVHSRPLQRLRVLLCFLSWARGTHGLWGCSRGRWWLWGACGSQWLGLPQGRPAAGPMRGAGRGSRPEGRTGGMHSWPPVTGGSGARVGTPTARASEHGRAQSPQPPWWWARHRDLEMAAGSSRPAWPCSGSAHSSLSCLRPPRPALLPGPASCPVSAVGPACSPALWADGPQTPDHVWPKRKPVLAPLVGLELVL